MSAYIKSDFGDTCAVKMALSTVVFALVAIFTVCIGEPVARNDSHNIYNCPDPGLA